MSDGHVETIDPGIFDNPQSSFGNASIFTPNYGKYVVLTSDAARPQPP
jgi:hypothetical protein